MERKRKKKKLQRRILIGFSIAIGVLFTAGVSLIAAWLILDYQGRSRLSAKQEAVPEGMQSFAAETQDFTADTEGEALQTGELRYQGKTYAYKSNIMTFLFMGIDKTGEMEASEDLFEGGQADALFLAVLDPDEKKISVIGINRDTMTEISVYDANGLYAGKEVAQIALAHACGRIGCFLAGCCYGRETDSFLGVVFPEHSMAPSGVKLLPTQLFSSAGDFLIMAILLLYSRKTRPKGRTGALYLILYGIGRFLIEFLRADDRGTVGSLSTSQFISIGIVAVGLILFFSNKLFHREEKAITTPPEE